MSAAVSAWETDPDVDPDVFVPSMSEAQATVLRERFVAKACTRESSDCGDIWCATCSAKRAARATARRTAARKGAATRRRKGGAT